MSNQGEGRWIAFEGGEGSGKTTQALLLSSKLQAVLTREPGGTVVGERIRALLLDPMVIGVDDRAEALLMAADRAQHVTERVRPALDEGKVVVSDRSAYSSLAYQGYGRGLGSDAVRALCTWATRGLWPDLAILLDVPPHVSAERMRAPADRMEAAGEEFHRRVQDGFRQLAEAEPDVWVVVDGTGTVREVADRVTAAYRRWAGVDD
ncbi:MAG: dTMP kinase [Actinobacteria bacterium]|nr:dTMP kinase [Actinomycetota bacterium]